MNIISTISAEQSSVWEASTERLSRQDTPAAVAAADRTAPESGSIPQNTPSAPNTDVYDHGEKPVPAGRYYPSKDEDGNPNVMFDDPAAPKEETCTANTDKVDAEIKKLMQKKAELEQQTAAQSENPDERARLQKQLDQVLQELSRKDTDSYRKQHTQFTSSGI